jgi:hypothetical protein
MNQLFDRIESNLKGHPMQHFLKSHFGGKAMQQIISKVCASTLLLFCIEVGVCCIAHPMSLINKELVFILIPHRIASTSAHVLTSSSLWPAR